jgi:VanZ family protein
LRYGVLAAALAIAVGYTTATSSPDHQIAWVERFHFVQYGLITFLFYRAWRPLNDAGVLILPAIAAMITATVEEWFQWFIPGRVGVMEDVFLNWVAIVCGLLFSATLDPPAAASIHLSRATRRHTALTLALFVIVFGMFFDSVHVGYEIRDPAIGTFTSIYTDAELHEHATDRAQRWATAPPIDRTRLAREDQYRTEGIQHVQERNRSWERGNVDAAWRENLILERYYAPVLSHGHAWPVEQRRDAETRSTAAAAGAYQSAAYPYRIYTWAKVQLWSGILVGVGVVLLVVGRTPADGSR